MYARVDGGSATGRSSTVCTQACSRTGAAATPWHQVIWRRRAASSTTAAADSSRQAVRPGDHHAAARTAWTASRAAVGVAGRREVDAATVTSRMMRSMALPPGPACLTANTRARAVPAASVAGSEVRGGRSRPAWCSMPPQLALGVPAATAFLQGTGTMAGVSSPQVIKARDRATGIASSRPVREVSAHPGEMVGFEAALGVARRNRVGEQVRHRGAKCRLALAPPLRHSQREPLQQRAACTCICSDRPGLSQ